MQRLDEILLGANKRPNRQSHLVYGVSAKPIQGTYKFVHVQICRSLCEEDQSKILQRGNEKIGQLDFVMPNGLTSQICSKPKCSERLRTF